MTPKYPQSDGRGIVPRKWSVDKTHGPLVVICEMVLKRLIQHGWPSDYLVSGGAALFSNALGSTNSFFQALADAVYIVSDRMRVRVVLDGLTLALVGHWYCEFRFGGAGKIVAVSIYETGKARRGGRAPF